MKVKLISRLALTLGLVASSLAPAGAVTYNQKTVYKATINNVTAVYIDATAGSRVAVDLGTQGRTYTRVAGACGEVKISPPKGNMNFADAKAADGTTIDGLNVDGTKIDYANLPTQTLPACNNGTFAETRGANFKTAKGQVVIVGKTAGASVSIKVPSDIKRTVGVNGCGFGVLRPQKGTALPATFSINGTNYTLADLTDTNGQAPFCRKTASGAYSTLLPDGWTK